MRPSLEVALLIGAVVVLVSVLAVRLGLRLGVPSLLIFLAIGLALGEAGFGIHFDNAALTRDLGLIALVVILAEGGLTTNLQQIRPALAASAVLATIGVAISVGVLAVAMHLLVGMTWRSAVLLGGVVSCTDAAAVFSVLRRLPLRSRISGILEAESGLNDAPAVVVVTLAASSAWATQHWWQSLGLAGYELVVGAAVGFGAGIAGRWLLPRLALPAAGLYPAAVLAIIMASFAVASLAEASGFLAVYVSALLLGSATLPHRRIVLGFAEGVAWLAQIGLFVLLGLLASPGRLPSALVPGLIAGLVLTLVARPLSVAACTSWFGVRWREQAFLSAAGLRGAVPIVLATVPLAAGVPGATRIFDMTFVLVLVFTAVQAPPLPWLARRLAVTTGTPMAELTVEAAPLDDMHAVLLEVDVQPGSKLAGEYVLDLRLPAQTVVTLIVRADRPLVPDPTTRIRLGDRMLVVTTSDEREATERRLRAVSRRGVLAVWFGESGNE